jgi:hypothetical protein
MNTNLKRFGKALAKESLKKIKGGDGAASPASAFCSWPEFEYANCKYCTAHSTDGSNITRSFGNSNYGLVDAWVTAWSSFGYRVECTIITVT